MKLGIDDSTLSLSKHIGRNPMGRNSNRYLMKYMVSHYRGSFDVCILEQIVQNWQTFVHKIFLNIFAKCKHLTHFNGTLCRM